MPQPHIPVTRVRAQAFVVPTDQPEADGTLAWDKTTLVVVHIESGAFTGVGYTYADASLVVLINDMLGDHIRGRDAIDIPTIYAVLRGAVRNLGRSGLASCAISAIDLALWDLKSRFLNVNLCALLGQRRSQLEIYGSGGFTTYENDVLARLLSAWVDEDGCKAVKMKIGSNPDQDSGRIEAARDAIGSAALFVDANGALTARQALSMVHTLSDFNVRWFEEPVSSDDCRGLALIRANVSAELDIAAGEYSYVPDDVRIMLEAGAVDVQQCDITRCGGITGFLQAAALCDAFHTPLSGHCAPSAHLHAACAVPGLRHLEWFHDHVRIEQMLFDGAPRARDGKIEPDLSCLGNGLVFKQKDAELLRYKALQPRDGGKLATVKAAQRLNRSSGLLAASVLLDSAVEHYRGNFNNPAMLTPIATSLVALLASLHGHGDDRQGKHHGRRGVFWLTAATGLIGTGFHLYNITKKPGGFSWQNLFYSAPLGAPAAIGLSGLFGLLAERGA